jgi:hypothetical protein
VVRVTLDGDVVGFMFYKYVFLAVLTEINKHFSLLGCGLQRSRLSTETFVFTPPVEEINLKGLGLSHIGSDGCHMWHAGEGRAIHTRICWKNLREKYRLEEKL